MSSSCWVSELLKDGIGVPDRPFATVLRTKSGVKLRFRSDGPRAPTPPSPWQKELLQVMANRLPPCIISPPSGAAWAWEAASAANAASRSLVRIGRPLPCLRQREHEQRRSDRRHALRLLGP